MRKKDKTKFPVARIKKIMQMDEEIGKMAQATPVLISKSLELFMQSIIDDMSKHARVCNSRKVTTTHLKRCVESTECYDFLKDIVESVIDDGDGGGPQACIARVAELNASGDTGAASSAGGGADAGASDGATDILGGGGGGAPLSMILDTLPTDDDDDDDEDEPAQGEGEGEDGAGAEAGAEQHKNPL
ncbi:hypothetical protein LPJ61_000922 [Coemansia biformis]|uniref:Transcription factor CBF/NF-Y/archaeal histone domain-containing protein n=1 Tax=Coemansia biformis TaxID=1286918 RepID=A0A9W7YAX5_9FUNG|nr:hypothetical protein LPJ61_000922 [Coemansia biformis]